MKRAVTWGVVLVLVWAAVGRLMERLGVPGRDCGADCWCRQPGMRTMGWVLPYGHRTPAEPAPRYWLYKKKNDEGVDVFSSTAPVEWGGHHSTRSHEVAKAMNDDIRVGDVVVAYQTDLKAVVGYLRIVRIEGQRDDKRLFVAPLHRMDPPFPIHDHKAGTALADSPAVRGMVMLRELSGEEMQALVRLSGAPAHLLLGGRAPAPSP